MTGEGGIGIGAGVGVRRGGGVRPADGVREVGIGMGTVGRVGGGMIGALTGIVGLEIAGGTVTGTVESRGRTGIGVGAGRVMAERNGDGWIEDGLSVLADVVLLYRLHTLCHAYLTRTNGLCITDAWFCTSYFATPNASSLSMTLLSNLMSKTHLRGCGSVATVCAVTREGCHINIVSAVCIIGLRNNKGATYKPPTIHDSLHDTRQQRPGTQLTHLLRDLHAPP